MARAAPGERKAGGEKSQQMPLPPPPRLRPAFSGSDITVHREERPPLKGKTSHKEGRG